MAAVPVQRYYPRLLQRALGIKVLMTSPSWKPCQGHILSNRICPWLCCQAEDRKVAGVSPNVDAVGEGVASAEADAGGGGPRHDQLQWSRPATGPVDRTGARAGRRVVIR
jgi:hypothetical protein